MIGIAMALGASASWAAASFVTVRPLQAMTVLRFALVRFALVAMVFATLTLVIGGFDLTGSAVFWPLVLSGVIGIGMGETLLYAAIRENGPQVGLFLFSLNIPLTFIMSCLLQTREFSVAGAVGASLILAGVLLGVRARGYDTNATIPPILSWGVLAGLGAAVGQAMGLFLTKSAFSTDASVIEVTAIRATAAVMFIACVVAAADRDKALLPPRGKTLRDVLLSALLSSGLGLFLANMSLKYGSPTVAAACLSLSPMFVSLINSILTRTYPKPSLLCGFVLFGCGLFLIT